MSIGQQGLWHAFRRDPGLTAFNVFLPTRMRAAVDVHGLRQAIEYVAGRHICLHSVFSDRDGELMQEVRPHLLPTFEVVDLSGASDSQAQRVVAAATGVPFDLEQGPLLRVQVYRLADDDWIVLAMTHHIVVDFWSLIIILDELRVVYPDFAQHRAPQIPPAENNFAQFVRDQQGLLASPRGDQLRDYWQQLVAQSASVLDLPTDRLRPSVFENGARNALIEFPATVVPQLTAVAARAKATPFAVVHAALQVFLGRLSGQTRFLIGSPFSGRSRGEYERTVGFFINMLPLPADLEGDPTFAQLIARTSDQLLGALEHEAYPIAQITHDARLPRDPSRSPLFQASCTFEKSHLKSEAGRASFLFPDHRQVWDFGGLPQESFYVPHPTCHYDLEFIFEQTENRLRGMLVACRALFEESSVKQMSENFSRLLQRLLDDTQRPLSQVGWGEPVVRLASTQTLDSEPINQSASQSTKESATVDRMIYAAVAAHPHGMALEFAGRQLSYAGLWRLATQIARHIEQVDADRTTCSCGLGASAAPSIVPIYTESGPLAFIGMLSAHLAGMASAAIDARQPAVDLPSLCAELCARYWLGDSRTSLSEEQTATQIDLSQWLASQLDGQTLVSEQTGVSSVDKERAGRETLGAEFTGESVRELVAADAPRASLASEAAYLVYTSGSTGRPKGVLVEHAAVCNTLRWRQKAVPLRASDRVLMLLSHQFDAALGIGWTTLTQGATLVWPDAEGPVDPERLLQQIIREQITVLPAVPSLLRVLVAHPLFAQCDSLRLIFTGGEALPVDLPSQVRQVSHARFWNFYGPSEAAIEATAADVTEHSPLLPVPIGRPIDNTQVLVLDASLQPVPDTVPGELAIAGAGLARGYWNGAALDLELTAQKFVRLGIDGDGDGDGLRVYLTGDRGRRLPDGQLQFLGRRDHQIKLRGYRIELGEIEAVLEAHPQVARAAATLHQAGTPQAQLLGFVSLRSSALLDSKSTAQLSAGLRRFASERLASYKVPTAIGIVAHMPLTSSGKVDRRRLPETPPDMLAEESFVEPATPLEIYLAAAWCESLQVERVSVDCNFFDAGGSSLQAALLTSQLSQQLGVHVPTALLFDLFDISHLALRLAQLHPQTLTAKFGEDCLIRQLSRVEALAAGDVLGIAPETSRLDSDTAVVIGDGPVEQLAARRQLAPTAKPVHSLLAPLKVSGSRTPIFMVHPPGGIVVCYRELARQLDPAQPLLALRSRGLHGTEPLPPTLSAMAADYLQAVRSYQPRGPYTLGGWSLGGLVAYEMAQQLLLAGEQVSRLILLDTTIPAGATELVPAGELVNVGLEYGIAMTLDELGTLAPEQQLRFLWEHAQALGVLDDRSPPEVVTQVLQDLQQLFHHHVQLSRAYRIRPFPGRIELVRPRETPVALPVSEDRGWGYLAQSVGVHFVSGQHHSMVQTPHVEGLAKLVAELTATGSI